MVCSDNLYADRLAGDAILMHKMRLSEGASLRIGVMENKMPAEAGILKSAAITYSRLATTIGRTGLTAVFGMETGVSPYV